MAAAVVDLVDVAFERSAWLKAATTTLYITGALSLIVAFLTGLQAQGTVLIPGMAYPVLAEHRQWALMTMTYCIVVAALRLVVLRGDGARSRKRRIALLGIGLVSVVLVQQTAERGRETGLRVRHRHHRRPRAALSHRRGHRTWIEPLRLASRTTGPTVADRAFDTALLDRACDQLVARFNGS